MRQTNGLRSASRSRAVKMSTDSLQTLPGILQLKATWLSQSLTNLAKLILELNQIRLLILMLRPNRLLMQNHLPALILFTAHSDLEVAKIKTLPTKSSVSWISSVTAYQLNSRMIQKSMMPLRKVSAGLKRA
jgi:hypothetical protein